MKSSYDSKYKSPTLFYEYAIYSVEESDISSLDCDIHEQYSVAALGCVCVYVGKKLELLNPDSDIVPKGQQIPRKSSA